MLVRICNMIGSLSYFRRCFEKHFSLCELSFQIVISCFLCPWEMRASVINWLDGFELLSPSIMADA